MSAPEPTNGLTRRGFLALTPAAALACSAPSALSAGAARTPRARGDAPAVLVGSANALAGMQRSYARLVEGADPLDVAIEVVKLVEADPEDSSVGLGGLPNEAGVVQLDAAVMHGPTHNAGAVACLENILHPCEVARLVMERTDHVLLVGRGAYEFARAHGHQHVELLTDAARRAWLEWKESMSTQDDRLPPRAKAQPREGSGGAARSAARLDWRAGRVTGTVHCSALNARGELGCTTTTSGLAWKIPGRVGDSPIVGAGLYCDQEGGSAGCTGRGEAAILASAAASAVAALARGAEPFEAGLELLERVTRQARRAASWQPELLDEEGLPSFGLKLYLLARDGRHAGVSLRGGGVYAVADPEGGPRHAPLVALHA